MTSKGVNNSETKDINTTEHYTHPGCGCSRGTLLKWNTLCVHYLSGGHQKHDVQSAGMPTSGPLGD